MARTCMLSTFDNPFNPFDNFDSWLLYDKEKHHDSCEKLARIAQISDDMSETEENEEIERAIDEIVKYDFMNVYKKVVSTTEDQSNETE